MAGLTTIEVSKAEAPPSLRRRFGLWWSWNWLGLLPFVLFIIAFQLMPALSIVVKSFQDLNGNFTLENVNSLNDPLILGAYWSSIKLSFLTALGGAFIGFFVAWGVTSGYFPKWIRSAILSFSGVASNFGGVPLAFAFVATIGQTGILTVALKSIGINLYPDFRLYSFNGLVIVYIYFQIPLMVLIMAPAFEGLRKEWSEASENLGASRFQYWRYVALPILFPSIAGTFALLFGNAFGAQATAFALIGGGGQYSVITLLVGSQFSSDTFNNPGIGNSLALGMIVVMVVTIFIYSFFRRMSSRWLKVGGE
ncbi:MAG: ABC transporter permease subunit [Chloroflexi bacterium]|nr:ABC transporter permease subunit [Chloroflexota bacterium]MCC6896135.1 ABC transporter permease subunit [Anaerolineae bacterium]